MQVADGYKNIDIQCFGKSFARFRKTKRVILIIFILICTLCRVEAYAQNELQFSGTSNMPTVMNPGAAGRSGAIQATAAYRKQWVGFDGAPATTVLGVDAEVKFLKSFHGLGAYVTHDAIGPYTTMNINANYCYHIELDKGLLGIGARFGAVNVAFDAADLSAAVSGLENDYHQETDPALDGAEDSGTAFDAGLGAFYQSPMAYLGFSLLHLTAPEPELKNGAKVKVRPLMTIAAGKLVGRDVKTFAIEPRLNFKTDFSSWQAELQAAALFKQKVWVALGCRLQDALLVGAGLSLANGLDIAYAYDLSLSKLRSYNSGSHEVSVSYTFELDVEKRTKRYKSVRIL